MNTLDCIRSRRSVRKFLDIPVEFEKLGNILYAGTHAPSAGNVQDWKFIVITDDKAKESIASACFEQFWISSAPLIIVVCGEPDKTKRLYPDAGEKFCIQSGAAVIDNVMLAAHDQGLGSCWVGAFDDGMLHRACGAPDNVLIHGVIPIGYPDEKPLMPVRFTLENVVFVGGWGNRISDIAAYMEWYGEHVQKAIAAGKQKIKQFIDKLQK